MEKVQYTDKFYDDIWGDIERSYEWNLDFTSRCKFPAIQKVWGDRQTPRTVLDYGCGNGVLTHWMETNGFGERLLAVDISEVGLEFARKHFQKPNIEFRSFEAGKESDLPAMDVLVASHVLEHLDDPGLVVRRILPLAEWFVLEVPLEDCLVQNAFAQFKSAPRGENSAGHVNFWTRDSFRIFLEQNGLNVIRDFQYACAPPSPYNPRWKRVIETGLLKVLGVENYRKIMSTHYTVLARKHTS